MSEKPRLHSMFIVLENGKPAVIKNNKVWDCCVFRDAEDAVKYATYWCGRILAGRDIQPNDWLKGVDISQTEDKCIISVDGILIPNEPAGLHYPPGARRTD